MKVKANLIQVFAAVLFLCMVVIDLGQDSIGAGAWRMGGGPLDCQQAKLGLSTVSLERVETNFQRQYDTFTVAMCAWIIDLA